MGKVEAKLGPVELELHGLIDEAVEIGHAGSPVGS